jgi:hypothetical protein
MFRFTKRSTASLALALVVGLLPGVSLMGVQAQTAPGAPGTSSTIPEKVQPQPDASTEGRSSGENLSDKLDQTNGVIPAPKGVDPEIRKPTPAAPNTMPIIPPPSGAQAK